MVKVERAWALLERGSSFHDVSPPPPPASGRETQQPPQRFGTAHNPVPLLGDAVWYAARRSLMPLIQPYNIHTTNESDLNDHNNEDDDGPPPLRGRRNDGNSNIQTMMPRCNAFSSLLSLTGTGEPINAGALHPLQYQPQRRPAIRNSYHHHHQPSNHAGPSRVIMEFFGQIRCDDQGEGQGSAHASTPAGRNNQENVPSGSDRERTGSPETMSLDYEQLPLD